MSRWLEKECTALAEMKRRVKDEVSKVPQFPEVVGDRRLIRFLRGRQNNVDEATKMYKAFLRWRKENHVDDIRNDILYGGKNDPKLFPKADVILQYVPQLVMAADARDFAGQPMVLEIFGFNPKAAFDALTMDEYLRFLIYCLEYRAMVLEQLSDQMEEEYLAQHPDPSTRKEGYGVVLRICCIRDLKGVGFDHMGTKCKQIISKSLEAAVRKYLHTKCLTSSVLSRDSLFPFMLA
jgi:hypothetical protein